MNSSLQRHKVINPILGELLQKGTIWLEDEYYKDKKYTENDFQAWLIEIPLNCVCDS